jgi:hypothetical protein
VTRAEDRRRRPGFHRLSQAGARRADGGPDQGLRVRRLGDVLPLSRGRRRARPQDHEIFAACWPYYDEDASHDRIAKLFNGAKKYVVSGSGEVDMGWAGSVLLRDVADAKRLKQEDGPNLLWAAGVLRAARGGNYGAAMGRRGIAAAQRNTELAARNLDAVFGTQLTNVIVPVGWEILEQNKKGKKRGETGGAER